ncbi:MAG: hypothetical protein E7214_05580 [Clostridium sp.]|nr:hypothetical protein [Clostridium sp.]
MKSKKVLVPVILIAVIIIAGIFTFNQNSNTETENKETSVTASVDSATPNKEESSNSDSSEVSSNSNKNSESKGNEVQNNKPKDTNNTSTNNDVSDSNKDTNQPKDSNNNSSTTNSNTANTTFSEKDAATNLLVYLLGNEELKSQYITPVTLASGSNVATQKEGSNIFYFNSEPLTENSNNGIIITILDYNSDTKTYKYELKDYADLLEGQDTVLAKGTVAQSGEVTTD